MGSHRRVGRDKTYPMVEQGRPRGPRSSLLKPKMASAEFACAAPHSVATENETRTGTSDTKLPVTFYFPSIWAQPQPEPSRQAAIGPRSGFVGDLQLVTDRQAAHICW